MRGVERGWEGREEEGEGREGRRGGGTGEHKVNTYVAELVNTILLLTWLQAEWCTLRDQDHRSCRQHEPH